MLSAEDHQAATSESGKIKGLQLRVPEAEADSKMLQQRA